MTTPPKSSAAAFVDLINDEYREIIKAESGALVRRLIEARAIRDE
jgi:hypothetical protein